MTTERKIFKSKVRARVEDNGVYVNVQDLIFLFGDAVDSDDCFERLDTTDILNTLRNIHLNAKKEFHDKSK